MYWPNKAQTPNGGKTAIKEETLKTVAEDEVARVHNCTKGVPSFGVGCGDHSHYSSQCKMTDPYVNWKLPTFIEENIMNIYILNISPHVWSRTCICFQLSVSSKVSYHSLGQFYPHNLFFFVLWRNGGVKYDFNWLDCISNCARSGSCVKKKIWLPWITYGMLHSIQGIFCTYVPSTTSANQVGKGSLVHIILSWHWDEFSCLTERLEKRASVANTGFGKLVSATKGYSWIDSSNFVYYLWCCRT